MAFDPSSIMQISENLPNPIAAKREAYTLAGEMDQETIRRMQVKQAQTLQAEEQRAKEIVRTAKNDTPQDRLQTAERLRKEVGPDYSNRFLKEAQGIESGDYAIQMQKLEVAGKHQELIVGAMDSVISQVATFKANNPGASTAMLNAKVQEIGIPAMRTLAQQHPELVPAIAQFASSPFANSYDGWKNAEAQSKEGRDRITSRLAQRREEISEEDLKLRVKSGDIQLRREELAERKEKLQEQLRKQGLLGDDDAKFIANQYLAGDKSVLIGLGSGQQGTANRSMVRHAIMEEGKAQGLSPADIAGRVMQFAGYVAEQQALARRQATILTAAGEADRVFKIVENASKKVDRSNWVPINTIVQKLETMKSDPKLGAFAQAIDTTVNVYARAIAPTGVPHEAARARALQILSTVTGQDDFEAKLDVMRQEIEAAVDTPDAIREMIMNSFKENVKPRAGSPAAAAAAATPGAGPPALQPVNPAAPAPREVSAAPPPGTPPTTAQPAGAPAAGAAAGGADDVSKWWTNPN